MESMPSLAFEIDHDYLLDTVEDIPNPECYHMMLFQDRQLVHLTPPPVLRAVASGTWVDSLLPQPLLAGSPDYSEKPRCSYEIFCLIRAWKSSQTLYFELWSNDQCLLLSCRDTNQGLA